MKDKSLQAREAVKDDTVVLDSTGNVIDLNRRSSTRPGSDPRHRACAEEDGLRMSCFQSQGR